MSASGPEGSIDKVLQPDGTYKWEVVPHPRAEELNPPEKKATTKASKAKSSLGGLTKKEQKSVKAPEKTFDNNSAE
tara:strand:- start:905 stop:1132 length:228 start_codon:yes stop_codon:yes gene_type:complete